MPIKRIRGKTFKFAIDDEGFFSGVIAASNATCDNFRLSTYGNPKEELAYLSAIAEISKDYIFSPFKDLLDEWVLLKFGKEYNPDFCSNLVITNHLSQGYLVLEFNYCDGEAATSITIKVMRPDMLTNYSRQLAREKLGVTLEKLANSHKPHKVIQ